MTHIDVRKHSDAFLYRCWVDGLEVSNRCFAADDVEGWADCYQVDDYGKVVAFWNEDGERYLLPVRLHGKVCLRRMERVEKIDIPFGDEDGRYS